jgi:hypothetical protein
MVPEQELVLRSMVAIKLKDLNKPRQEVFIKDQPQRKRIINLVAQNEKNINKFEYPGATPSQVSLSQRRRMILDKNEIENYEKLTRSEFNTKQGIVMD